jgi:hypothetical protein
VKPANLCEVSTKSQAPAFAEAASRRQAKYQINLNYPIPKQNLSGHLDIGAYLGFVIWNLEFKTSQH